MVPELEEGDGEAYGLPYDLIETILAAMPDTGRPIKGKGKKHGGAKGEGRPAVSLTKIRGGVIAYAGLSHAEIGRLDPDDPLQLDLEAGWVNTGRRRKGKGVATGRRPLTPHGIKALQAFKDAKAKGRFSASSMRTSIRRACEKVAQVAEQKPGGAPLAAALRRIRPYDFRHSYVSEVLEKSADFHATQLLAGHADMRTTLRYGKKAVNPVLMAALEKVRLAGGFAAPDKRANAVSVSNEVAST